MPVAGQEEPAGTPRFHAGIQGVYARPVDLGVRYHGNGEVEYLMRGDIIDNPDGSITITPTLSEANLLSFQLGISIGVGASRSGF